MLFALFVFLRRTGKMGKRVLVLSLSLAIMVAAMAVSASAEYVYAEGYTVTTIVENTGVTFSHIRAVGELLVSCGKGFSCAKTGELLVSLEGRDYIGMAQFGAVHEGLIEVQRYALNEDGTFKINVNVNVFENGFINTKGELVIDFEERHPHAMTGSSLFVNDTNLRPARFHPLDGILIGYGGHSGIVVANRPREVVIPGETFGDVQLVDVDGDTAYFWVRGRDVGSYWSIIAVTAPGGTPPAGTPFVLPSDCVCANCTVCGFCGGVYGFGRVRGVGGGDVPAVDDALEILKYVVGLDNLIEGNPDALIAARIMEAGTENAPGVNDALEILKFVVGLESVLNEHYER
jgi:hypothetical protein